MTRKRIFEVCSLREFESMALDIFRYQAVNSQVYNSFLRYLKVDITGIERISQIPFLPIQFFKTHKVLSSNNGIQQVFLSSGTTGNTQSKHYVTDAELYKESFRKAFEYFYGAIEDFVVIALLPSYLEREGSSLIYMVDDLIKASGHQKSGFYLHNFGELQHNLVELDKQQKKVLLMGVSFALLELVEHFQFQLKNTIILETGGMKGKRKELIRKELHEQLCKGFGVNAIHSEYGMTELLSQAYSKGKGLFECPPWMKMLIRDTEDPFTIVPEGKSGGINVIDLANVNSCSFIATQDLGKAYHDGSFEVLGRFDNADIRGCNLMVI